MHRSLQFTAFAAFASSVLAFEFPDSVPLHKRQDLSPGSPLYECHANCGGVIVDARSSGYCTDSTYQSQLAACLECALTDDIWQYYGTDVAAAAQACGDNATPSPSSATSGAASTSVIASSTSAAAVITPAAATTSASAGAVTSSAVSAGSSSAAEVAITTSPTASAAYSSGSSVYRSASGVPIPSSNSTVSSGSSSPSIQAFTGAAVRFYSGSTVASLAVALVLGMIATAL